MRFELDTFNRNVSDEELLQDLVAAHAKLQSQGKNLTFRSYGKVGKYTAGTIGVRLGSWNDALRKAGLVVTQEKNVSTEELFDNLKNVWIAKGRQPVFRDMTSAPSLYSSSTYAARFGGWRKALEEFVASVDKEQQDLVAYEVEVKNSGISKRTKRDPSLALKFLVLKRHNFSCAACGRSPANVTGLTLEIDHVVPWSKGGETIAENLQSLCFDCNRGKGATLP
jgi:hypothetical protein